MKRPRPWLFVLAGTTYGVVGQFVGVVMAPRRSSVFRHIEFLRLSERRYLVIIA